MLLRVYIRGCGESVFAQYLRVFSSDPRAMLLFTSESLLAVAAPTLLHSPACSDPLRLRSGGRDADISSARRVLAGDKCGINTC